MSNIIEVKVPDIGDFQDVEVIDVLVKVGDQVNAEEPLITLESDKASMDVPSSHSGVVAFIMVRTGDRVSEGTSIVQLEASEAAVPEPPSPEGHQEQEVAPPKPTPPRRSADAPQPAPGAGAPTKGVAKTGQLSKVDEGTFATAHASPSVRAFARELGADLGRIKGTGRKGRVLREDVLAFVKGVLSSPAASSPGAAGAGIPPIPPVDFSKFGPTETVALPRIQKISGPVLHRAWLNVPHVTHHDEADITELDGFRKALDTKAKKEGYRVTLLSFIMKGVAVALKEHPQFNASLAPDQEHLILKKYYNLGVAVDTPNGLVVPVVRDVDKKGVIEISKELGETSLRAREGKLGPNDLRGGCFSISSLGGIGGTAFTPIVFAPEVAILGVTRSKMKPEWNGEAFVPRLMLPLSVSYDHRVIDGAAAARFTRFLAELLSDARRMLL